MTLHVELVSPEQVLYSGDASMVVARTSGGGDIAFLTGHAPFLGVLEPGVVRVIEEEGAELRVAVFGGFVEVNHDRVSILSDAAELSTTIDVDTSGASATKPRTSCAPARRRRKRHCGWPTSGSPPRTPPAAGHH